MAENMEITGGDGLREIREGPRATIAPAVAYMVMSSTLSVLNRYLYHRTPPFRFPSLLISTQAVIMGSLTIVGMRRFWRVECRASEYWPSRLERGSLLRVSVVGLLFGADIFLTQFALLHGPVALVELLKCLIPVIVLGLVSVLHRSMPALQDSAFMVAITAGIVIATRSDGVTYDLEPGGFMMAVFATLAGATRVCAMQMLLQGERRCPMPLVLLYVIPALLLTGVTLFLLYELQDFRAIPEALHPPHLASTAGIVVLSSLLAFAVNLSELWCVRDTSALFFTLVGALKTIVLVLLTTLVAGRTLSPKAVLGSALAVGGVAAMNLSGSQIAGAHGSSAAPSDLRGTMLDPDNCGEDSS